MRHDAASTGREGAPDLLGYIDIRNYAERMIMQSARSTELRPALFSTVMGFKADIGQSNI
jgi:hypothetical protein